MCSGWGMYFKAEDLGCIPLIVKISPAVIETKIEPNQIASNDGSTIHVIANQ